MKVVVDTNVAFSAVLNTSGKIGDLLFNSGGLFTFYSCDFLKLEMQRHKPKLLKATRQMTETQIDDALSLVFERIVFISESLIDAQCWLNAQTLVHDIDRDDTDFVALSEQLEAILWTGDKPLYMGLRAKNYGQVLTTDNLWDLRVELIK